ncbi:MAG: hypothetical protein HKP61_01540 [Dactylosporangium sp.]|nr:hypothetical protein [Dactylosporangium sp.]NNJ59648.1 hypothetical protein [Dactylosporangium sp.]
MAPTSAGRSGSMARWQILAALAAGLWFAWMGWDTTCQTDPVTRETSGP